MFRMHPCHSLVLNRGKRESSGEIPLWGRARFAEHTCGPLEVYWHRVFWRRLPAPSVCANCTRDLLMQSSPIADLLLHIRHISCDVPSCGVPLPEFEIETLRVLFSALPRSPAIEPV